MKEQQSIFFLMPVKIRIKLEQEADNNGVNMSWIIRSLIQYYRMNSKKMPVFKRPHSLNENHVRFSLKLYGNKSELLTYCRCNGGEFSAFVRYLLEEWVKGNIVPDLDNVKTVKNVNRIIWYFTGIASIIPVRLQFYQQSEYRLKNQCNNYYFMHSGLSHRKYPLIY